MRALWAGSASTLDEAPRQVVRSGAGDLDRGVRAGPQWSGRREVHQPVLAGPRRHDGGILPARALDEHLLDPADPGPVAGERAALDDDPEPLEPLTGHGGVDEPVGERRRLGARAGREDERVGVVEPGAGGDLEGLGEVPLGLAREADDDVGRHGEVRHDPAGLGEPVEVALGRVAAVHRGEDTVRTRLQRVVQVLADGRGLRHRGERLGAHVLGMGRREADPADSLDCPGRTKQVGEQRPHLHRGVAGPAGGQLQVTPVAVHVLAEQGDLGDPRGGELLDLGDDLLERAGDLDARARPGRCRRRSGCRNRSGS